MKRPYIIEVVAQRNFPGLMDQTAGKHFGFNFRYIEVARYPAEAPRDGAKARDAQNARTAIAK